MIIVVSGMWAKQLQNHGSIISRRKRFFMMQIIKVSSGAHPASCLMGTGGLNPSAEE
jgi:hypothetical protein